MVNNVNDTTNKIDDEQVDDTQQTSNDAVQTELNVCQEELQNIKAQKDYEIAEFYNKQNNQEAAGIYYKQILKTYSFSKWAVLAERKLREMQTKGSKNE